MRKESSSGHSGFERRRHPRLDRRLKTMYAVYSLDTGFDTSEERQEKLEARTYNISVGGLLLETSCEASIGAVLKLEIIIPDWGEYILLPSQKEGEEIPFIAFGKVLRSQAIEKHKRYHLGIEFVKVEEAHQDALSRYITKELKEEGGSSSYFV